MTVKTERAKKTAAARCAGKGNVISVASGDEIRVSHNRIVDIRTALMGRTPFASFLAIGGGELGAGVPLAVVPAERAEYNSDPSRGALFAVYTARITDEILPPGTAVSEAGLCAYESGTPLSDYASFPAVVKRAGVDLVVRAELEPDFSSEFLVPTAGENALVEVFLGIRAFGKVELAHGRNYHPTAPVRRKSEGFIERVEAAESFTDEGVTFGATFSVAPLEYVMLMDGKAVARGYYYEGASVVTGNGLLGVNSSLERLDPALLAAAYVTNVSRVDKPFYEVPYVTELTADCRAVFDWKLPASARFLSEPSGSCLGIRDGREITVYALKEGKLAELYRFRLTSGSAELISDGSLLVADGAVTLYAYSEESGDVEPTLIGCSTASEAHGVFDAGEYRIGAVERDAFRLFKVKDGAVSETETISPLPADFGFARHDRCLLDFWSASEALYRSEGPGGQNNNNRNRIRDFLCATDKYEIHDLRGRWARYRDLSDGAEKVSNFEGQRPAALDENESAMFAGEFVIVLSGGRPVAFRTWSSSSCELRDVPADVGLGPIADAATLGRYLLALGSDGRVTALYASPGGLYIVCPYLQSQTRILYGLIYADDPRGETGKADVRLTIGYGTE